MSENERTIKQMRQAFEASLLDRVRRASTVKLQQVIPHHWFAEAASECAGMYVAGFFYGAVSLAQAYIEALSKYLANHHGIRVRNDIDGRFKKLHKRGVISASALRAALRIYEGRNDFHHLNESVEQDPRNLEARAEECIRLIYVLESEIFAYSFSEASPGTMLPAKPEYWPSPGPGMAQVRLRQLW